MSKSPLIVIGLLWMLHGVGLGEIGIDFDAPQDDRKVRQKVEDRAEMKPVARELNDLIETRFWPLTPDEVDKFFGPKFAARPQDLVLPVFSPDGMMMSGISAYGSTDKSHADLHALGDVGYVEFYFNLDGSVATGVLYDRADSEFVPLKSDQDFLKRLDWDEMKFQGIKKWLAEHLPKITDFGDVVVSDHNPNRVHFGNGEDYLVTAMVDSQNTFSVQLMVDSPNEAEQNKSVLYREIDRPDEPIGFSVDGQFYRLTPELKSKPTKTNLGVVVLTKNVLTPLNVGAGRECIASLRKQPNGPDSIYLAIRCKNYSQGISPLVDSDGSISFAIDGNMISFTPRIQGK